MSEECQSNRKHYRVYTKKNKKDLPNHFKIMENKSFIYGIIGLAFLKGIFWGYLLKSKRR